ncbi:helix-turn-helix domain-containing protein [Paenalcaligenes niemegkensis]|uniref:helix-turn-helix transcriptional regulator n=1 Tax=Paenalcaligenes niemegkensis TaxID=2895469 RepID=UPI001EE92F56|nr:helix-turn-helix domain-containing protein [Paenalcaligenes niemegkensis]MCQ9616520.1 helix-turn-helix domain-containing protein [Paenalcaligenes niemegkensis]
MHDGKLIVVVSKVPERISKFTSNLRSFTSNFLFFSDVSSFLARRSQSDLLLIVIDDVDDDLDIDETLNVLRKVDEYRAAIIFVIVSEDGHDSGITALKAGSNDYLAFPLVDRELAARVRIHLNSYTRTNENFLPGCSLNDIYPLEDRVIIKSAVWYINHHISSVTNVSALSLHVGSSEKDINRAFRTHLGQTASAYMRAFRITKAKDLLVKTRFPIIQIAQEVGYSSSANFSTAFKNIVGMSPTQYRVENV